jgi:uncharacterized protein YbaP (TraB family)
VSSSGAYRRLVAAGLAVCALACAFGRHAAPAMWEVRDHDTRIYLFGAMHVLQPNVKWRTRAFDRAYAQADKVWFETRADADPAEVQALVDRYGVDPERPLTEKLPPRTVATLKAALERDGGSLDRVDRLRPWAAAMMLSVLPMTQQGASVQAGADATVTRQARAADKPIATFETLEQQIQAVRQPARGGRGAVPGRRGVRDPDAAAQRRGPAVGLAARRHEQAGSAGGGRDEARPPGAVRGPAQAPQRGLGQALVAEMAKPGVELVAVGALHMAGEDGLPALMAARGFQVRRVQ